MGRWVNGSVGWSVGGFESVTGMRVAVQEREGDSVKHMAKPEPLREKRLWKREMLSLHNRWREMWEKWGRL